MKSLAMAHALKKRSKKHEELKHKYPLKHAEGMPSHEEMEHEEMLNEKEAPIHHEEEHEMAHGGMIERILAKHYSKGGMVANDVEPIADEMSANYDYLSTHDDLEEHLTGANSGDELGDAQEDHDRKDIIARILKSRAKKDRMPRPA